MMYVRISAAAAAAAAAAPVVVANLKFVPLFAATVQLAPASQKGTFLSAAQRAFVFGNGPGTSVRRGFKQAVTGFHY